MRNARFHTLSAPVLAGCFLGIALAISAQPEIDGKADSSGSIRTPADTNNWAHHFRVGVMVGMNISARFSEQGLFNISGNNAVSGIYDDGYVREDQTGNAGGYTSYWGYNNASQYNAANQTLLMHSTMSYSTTGNSEDNGSPFPGFDIAYGDNLWHWNRARVGWEFGFGLLPISITDKHSMSATVNQSVYSFDTGGIVVPAAPYQGGSSGQGPLLPGTPASVTSQTFSSGTVTGTRTLDVILYTMRLGPSLYWDLTKHVGMSLGAGPAFGIVSGDYKHDETIAAGGVSARDTGRLRATDMVFGGYVNAAVMYHAVDNGDFFAGVQYMPLGDAAISGGGREGRLNLAGQLNLTIGINWQF